MRQEVPQSPLVLDFGMHEGEDTEFYLACGANVIAFEANQDLVERNQRRFAAEVSSGQLQIVSGAVVPPDFSGSELTFYLDSNKSVWGTTSREWAERNAGLGSEITPISVAAIDLKSIIDGSGGLLYAKIDIEGADRFVLDTFKVTRTRPEFLSIESDKLNLSAVIEEIQTLEDLGYSRFAAVQQAAIPGSTLRGQRFDGRQFSFQFKKHGSGPFGPYLKQDYKTAGEVIDQYRSIFDRYARYGDRSWLMRSPSTRLLTRAVNWALVKTFKAPLCGWYDTHAAR